MNAVAETVQETKELPAWVHAVEKAKPRFIKQAALHGAVQWDSEAAYIRQAIQNNPDLQQCTQASLTNAIELIGSIGITTSPLDKLAFLQARNVKLSAKDVKPEVWVKQAELKIQFTGLIKIVVDSGAASYMRADVVHENDDFTYHGPTTKPDFTVKKPFDINARGAVVGAFAEALGADGITYCEILTLADLASIKSASKTSHGPWANFENEMRKKAAIRRLYKTIPKSNERIRVASSLSAENDGFFFPEKESPVATFTADQKNAFDKAVKDDDCIAIWHMGRSLPTSIWTDLYNSGEKGHKVKLKAQVDELGKKGFLMFDDAANDLRKLMGDDDGMGALQILEEFEDQRSSLDEQIANNGDELVQWIVSVEE